MKAADIYEGDPIAHCCACIRKGKSDHYRKHKEVIDSFHQQYFREEKHLQQFVSYCWFHFYKPHFKCDESMVFPNPSKYEIRIPYKQANPHGIQYVVVPVGSQPGDRVVVINGGAPAPPTVGADIAALLSKHLSSPIRPLQSFDEPIRAKLCDSRIELFPRYLLERSAKYAEAEGAAQIGGRLTVISDEPFIRLPCYNIALQCAHRMVYEYMWFLELDTMDIWTHMEQDKVDEVIIERTAPEIFVFEAMLWWATFEFFNLTPDERMDWLMFGLRKKGSHSTAKQFKSRYQKIKRYFARHLRLVKND